MLAELGEKYRGLRSEQAGRKQVVEHKRTARMSLTREGTLEVAPQPSFRGSGHHPYRDHEEDD
jgi:hypothetical protein